MRRQGQQIGPASGTSILCVDDLNRMPVKGERIVDRLEDAGLVRRERDEADRRRVFLTLTAKANRLLEKLSAEHLAQIRRDAPQLIALLRDVAREDSDEGS